MRLLYSIALIIVSSTVIFIITYVANYWRLAVAQQLNSFPPSSAWIPATIAAIIGFLAISILLLFVYRLHFPTYLQISLALFVSLVGIGYTIWSNWSMLISKQYEILETRDFSCPGMEGFTFEYPVFKGWEVSEIREMGGNECFVFLNWPAEFQIENSIKRNSLIEPAPQIKVSIIPTIGRKIFEEIEGWWDQKLVMKSYKNPQQIKYFPWDTGHIFDFNKDKDVKIELIGINDKYGFSKGAFFKQVIESFRIIQKKDNPLIGSWKWEDNKRMLEFGLKFQAEGPDLIRGYWWGATLNANRVDVCIKISKENPCLLFKKSNSNEIVTDFTSGYGGGKGKVKLSYDAESDRLIWEITERPRGEYYLPIKAILVRANNP